MTSENPWVTSLPDYSNLDLFFKSVKAKDRQCLHPSGCSTNVKNRAHSISRNKVLSLLELDGHVITTKMNYEFSQKYGLTILSPFRSVGWNEASTFTGMCQPHDAELFESLDTGQPNWYDPKYQFLTAYRGILKQVNQHRNANAIQTAMEIKLSSFDMYKASLNLENTQKYKKYWDQILISNSPNWEEIEHTVFLIDNLYPSVAATQLVSIDDIHPLFPPNMVISVIPEKNRTICLFSYTREEAPFVKQYLDRHLPNSAENTSFTKLLSRLLLQHCDNIIISPNFWMSIHDNNKILIEDYFIHTLLANNHTFPADNLNLFKR